MEKSSVGKEDSKDVNTPAQNHHNENFTSIEQEALYDTIIAKVAVANKLITDKQLKIALDIQKKAKLLNKRLYLENIFLKKEWLSPDDVSDLQNATKRRLGKKFGAIAVEKGLLQQEEVDAALAEQSLEYQKNNSCRRIGDILVDHDLLTDEQRLHVWKHQLDLIVRSIYLKRKEEKDIESDIHSDSLGELIEVPSDTPMDNSVDNPVDDQSPLELIEEPSDELDADESDTDQIVTDEPVADEPVADEPVADEHDADEHDADEHDADEHDADEHDADESDNDEAKADEADIKDIIILKIAGDKLEAYICISDSILDIETAFDYIKQLLVDYGIVYGIAADETIVTFLREQEEQSRTLTIARGIPSVDGRDTVIKYLFETDYLKAGTVLDGDGKIDYRDRGEIPHVSEGEIIAEKIMHIDGEEGIDVCGYPVHPREIQILDIQTENNVEISDDGLQALSTIKGRPHMSINGVISVYDEVIIEGDVDYSTGNIDYAGNIIVKGVVQNGFTVKCNNFTALAVNDAFVDVAGDVTITNGITGSEVRAKGQINAKYIKASNIKAFSNVCVEKEVYDCKIRTSGEFISAYGNIISSFVAARQGITSRNVGTDISPPCKLFTGVDDHIKNIFKGLDNSSEESIKIIDKVQPEHDGIDKRLIDIVNKIEELTKKLGKEIVQKQSIEKAIKTSEISEENLLKLKEKTATLNSNIKELEHEIESYSDRKINLMEKLSGSLEKIDKLIQKIEDNNDEKASIKKWTENVKRLARVKVTESLFSGTTIKGHYSSIVIEDTVSKVNVIEMITPDSDYFMEVKFDNS